MLSLVARMVFYLVHPTKTDQVESNKKLRWTRLLILGRMVAMPFYSPLRSLVGPIPHGEIVCRRESRRPLAASQNFDWLCENPVGNEPGCR